MPPSSPHHIIIVSSLFLMPTRDTTHVSLIPNKPRLALASSPSLSRHQPSSAPSYLFYLNINHHPLLPSPTPTPHHLHASYAFPSSPYTSRIITINHHHHLQSPSWYHHHPQNLHQSSLPSRNKQVELFWFFYFYFIFICLGLIYC